MDEVVSPGARPPAAIVLLGVAGSGKSVAGSRLAAELGYRFIEGDQLHPPENVARMASGEPFTHAHRWGWLDTIGERLASSLATGHGAVAACSALKRIYRDRLRGKCPEVIFIYIAIDRETARTRVQLRKGHFMPPSLVDSQFATLEPPVKNEDALTLDGTRPVGDLVAEMLRYLGEPVS